MAASVPPDPRLGKSQALNQAQGTVSRLAGLIPNVATELSPVTIYQPGATVGGQLTAGAGNPVILSNSYGVWVAPDLNGDGSTWYATVECFGGGGGAGGGNSTQGGGGGGGAEYACETQYPITPGASYVYIAGLGGSGGFNNQGGAGGTGTQGLNGGATVFDLAGLGLAGGVVANGGQGGDMTSVGIGGLGGSGSSNSIHFNGGNGGSNVGGNGSDNPTSLSQTSGMFVGNTLSTNIIQAWYIMNDSNFSSATRNDSSAYLRNGTWTNYTGGDFQTFETAPAAPAQVPAYTSTAGTYGPNQTTAQWTSGIHVGTFTKPGAKFSCGGLNTISGTKFTISAWVQGAQGSFGNTANSSFAVVTANSTNINLASFKGFGLYFFKDASGVWRLYAQVGNGTTRYTINSNPMTPASGTWYYVVMTYNSGTLSLYVNGSLVSSTTTTGYTSVPAGAFATVIGMDPATTGQFNWFDGVISNIWYASDCATSTLVTQAFGLTAPTGGAGGGASGGPSAVGGNGVTASGATGGAGGTPATQPASLTSTTTAAQGGYSGALAGTGNASPLTPSGGPYGGGGGGSGDMVSPPALMTLTYQFPAAATYAGVDALSNPGSPYNVNQQNNPNSGLNSVLYASGLASDASSGSKNSLLLLPAGIRQAINSATYTITSVTLTLTNAFPANTVESLLEVGYTSDTSLPQTYNGASLIDYVAIVEIPPGAGTVTYDMTQTGLAAEIANGTATAILLGPGQFPTIDAYNAVTGPEFYCAVYGPGAYDTSGNPLYPYLTITLQKTITTQQGSNGSCGGILITSVTNASTPVAFVEPFAGADAAGNQFISGFTGNTAAFDPNALTPGSYKPESWHTPSISLSGWAQTSNNMLLRYRLLPTGDLQLCGDITGPAIVGQGVTLCSLLSGYYTSHFLGFTLCRFTGTLSVADDAIGQVTTTGTVTLYNCAGATRLIFNAIIPLSAT